jgi:hypothetical protein
MSSHPEDLHLIQHIKTLSKTTINKYPTSIIFLNGYFNRGHPPPRKNPTRHHKILNINIPKTVHLQIQHWFTPHRKPH